MLKKYLSLFLIFLFIVLIWSFRENIFAGLNNFKNSNQVLGDLRLENQGLRLEINELKKKLNLRGGQPLLTVQVYSLYPFNDNQNLIIDAGSQDGVKVDWPVLASEGHLLGKIAKVKFQTSEVKTIFSSDWRSTVKIGKAEIEAVLVGGPEPKLELIPADAEIHLGDEVFNFSSDLPLNLFVGRISQIISSSAASLKTAKITTDYKLGQIRKVLVKTDFEISE